MTVDRLEINEFEDLAKLFSKNEMELSYGSGFLEVVIPASSDKDAQKKIENILRVINTAANYNFVLDYQRVNKVPGKNSEFQAKLYAMRKKNV